MISWASKRRPGRVRAIYLNEDVTLEAGPMQDQVIDYGERTPARDLLITATARSTGDELVVADGDFEMRHLTKMMDITNPRDDD